MRTYIPFFGSWLLLAMTTAWVGAETLDNEALDVAADACVACGGVDSCACGEGLCGGDNWCLFPQGGGGLNIRGWIDAGFMGNTGSPVSKFNGPYNAVDRSNEVMANQLYLIAEKELPNDGLGIGARLDVLYGEDYLLAESAGMERRPDGSPRWNPEYYGLALPQAYVSFGNKDVSFQVGHFYTPVGYEGVPAPNNFFYSKSYSYQFAGPFTHWGGMLNWKISNSWTVQAGLTNGWDALDRPSDNMGFVGKVRYDSAASGWWTSFAIVTGEEFNNLGDLPIRPDFTNRTRYSWLVGLPLTCRIDYVFHHWLGLQEQGAIDGGQADWYGIDQYLFYTVNDCWKWGVRFEWFRDEEGTRVGLNRPSNPNVPPFPGNVYSLSAGVNWAPTDNFVLRPEIRADWYDGNVNAPQDPYGDGDDASQLMLGFDAIFLF